MKLELSLIFFMVLILSATPGFSQTSEDFLKNIEKVSIPSDIEARVMQNTSENSSESENAQKVLQPSQSATSKPKKRLPGHKAARMKSGGAQNKNVSHLTEKMPKSQEGMDGTSSSQKNLKAQINNSSAKKSATDVVSDKNSLQEKNVLSKKLYTMEEQKLKAERTIQDLNIQVAILTKKNATLTADLKENALQLAEDMQILQKKLSVQEELKLDAERKMKDLRTKVIILTEKNAALSAESDKNLVQLTAQNKALTAKIAGLENKKSEIKPNCQNQEGPHFEKEHPPATKLVTVSDKYSYSLGVAFFKKIENEVSRFSSRNIIIDVDTLLRGINDANEGKPLLSDSIVKNTILDYNEKIKKEIRISVSKIKKEIKGKKAVQLSDSSYLVVVKEGKSKYIKDELIAFDVEESYLTGEVIVNSMNNHSKNDKQAPQFLSEAIRKGGKGGIVMIYALAADFYSPEEIPKGVNATSPIRFKLTLR
ncbi:FKBP-type peptidyl-prolyl cis-trans isomerase N-terminal domain-containing protein [Enterobacter kobei]|uniref:FKBP-type peptidyl-prolyl cis-trans isomerase N-terminal domain-containing protein n=1 Tax=Enterobacter kobei TaxID=208224 RepID=UPI0006821504|nr:FKBP-type peptidyl-prolyl cis-trans isomerase N-terminal domain-containing protein [Enterobacter kobei]